MKKVSLQLERVVEGSVEKWEEPFTGMRHVIQGHEVVEEVVIVAEVSKFMRNIGRGTAAVAEASILFGLRWRWVDFGGLTRSDSGNETCHNDDSHEARGEYDERHGAQGC